MKCAKYVKFIIALLLVTIFVNCSTQNQDSKIQKLPQIIDPDTGLRELRFRRYNCLHLPSNETQEDCTKNEEILEVSETGKDKGSSTSTTNLRVNELTPWLQSKSRTVLNPSVKYNDVQEKVLVTAYLRMSDESNSQKNFKYNFEGDLKTFRTQFRRTGKQEYLKLKKTDSEAKEIVNAVIYCYDNPTCKDITLVLSFINFDKDGQSFIDSRPFQMDQREETLAATDGIPKKAARTITEPVFESNLDQGAKRSKDAVVSGSDEEDPSASESEVESEEGTESEEEPEPGLGPTDVEADESLDEFHNDAGFSAGPLGPAIPDDESNSLCEGLVSEKVPCTDYVLDFSIPRVLEKPFKDTLLNQDSTEESPTPPLTEIKPLKNPALEVSNSVSPIDEEIFADESRILNREAPRLMEPNTELLPYIDISTPVPDSKQYDSNLYHQFIEKLRLDKEKSIWENDQTPNNNSQKPSGGVAASGAAAGTQPRKSSMRPRARPDYIFNPPSEPNDEGVTQLQKNMQAQNQRLIPNSNQRINNQVDQQNRNDNNQNRLAEGSKSSFNSQKSEIANTKVQPPQSVDAEALTNQSEVEIPFESVDGKFTYDLALCGTHLVEAKNTVYKQARGEYWAGHLKNAIHYGVSLYEPNTTDPAKVSSQYASGISKQVIEFAGCVLEQRYRNNINILIKSFSLKDGGQLGRHGSHQNGLDVDVSYPHLDGKTKGFDDFTSNTNEQRTVAAFDYARLLLYTDRVHVLFTDRKIRKKFCKYLKDQDKLSEFRNVVERYMYHVARHHDHFHVRMKCNRSQNEGCVHQEEFPDDNYCRK